MGFLVCWCLINKGLHIFLRKHPFGICLPQCSPILITSYLDFRLLFSPWSGAWGPTPLIHCFGFSSGPPSYRLRMVASRLPHYRSILVFRSPHLTDIFQAWRSSLSISYGFQFLQQAINLFLLSLYSLGQILSSLCKFVLCGDMYPVT